jgi:hypothetical protein
MPCAGFWMEKRFRPLKEQDSTAESQGKVVNGVGCFHQLIHQGETEAFLGNRDYNSVYSKKWPVW